MKSKTKRLVTMVGILFPTMVLSSNILNKINGSVGLEYQSQQNKTKDNTSKKTTLSEFIELGYSDFIYSVNLLEYAFQVKFDMQETDENNDNSSFSSSKRVDDYNLDLKFLQKSNVPFFISASNSSKPSTQVTDDDILETTYKQQKYNLRGSVNLNPKFYVNYALGNSVTDSSNTTGVREVTDNDYDLSVNYFDYTITTHYDTSDNILNSKINEDQQTFDDNYKIGVKKRFQDFTLNTEYESLTTDTIQNYGTFNKENDVSDILYASLTTKDHFVDVRYTKNDITNSASSLADENNIDLENNIRSKLSDTVSFYNSYYSTEESISETTNFTNNFNLFWEPTKDYNLRFMLFTNQYETPTTENINNGADLNSYYKVSEQFSTRQSLAYYTNDTETDSTDTTFADVSGTYLTPIGERSSMDLIGKTSILDSKGTQEEDNGRTYDIDLTAGVTNRFDNINSILDYDLNYYHSFSTLQSEEQKVRLDADFETKFIYNINYISELDYTWRKILPLDDSENTVEKTFNFANGIRTYTNIDVRGMVNGDFGLKYSQTQRTNTESTSSLNPYGRVDFMYRLWRTLTFKSSAEVTQDSLTDLTYYRIDNELLYRFRKLTIELNVDYNEQTGGPNGSASASNFMLTMKRNF